MSEVHDPGPGFEGLSRVNLAALPTPLQPLPNLAERLGVRELWIKRDDLTGLAFGGNKTRKLEFIIGGALESGAESVITVGALQSNHCRQTAAAAARYGLSCTLVLLGEQPGSPQGNVLLDRLLGADLIFSAESDPHVALETTVAALNQSGRNPFVVPYGGTSPAGMAAYMLALRELLAQNSNLDRIVFATSSGGTQAGLVVGARQAGFEGRITGISVDREAGYLKPTLARLANSTADLLALAGGFQVSDFEVLDGYLGGGYAVVSDLEIGAINRFAREEGVLLDPVYTGRAAGAMIDLIGKGEIGAEERIVFWHTGGTPALFAYPPVSV